MGRSLSIVIGAALIAAAVLITNHWQVVHLAGVTVARLDRWSGRIVACQAITGYLGDEFYCDDKAAKK